MLPTRVIGFLLLLLAGVGLTGCGEGDDPEPLPPLPAATDLTVQLVTANLNLPVFMTVVPGDNSRLFVVEQGGTVRIFTGSALLATPFLNITGLVRTAGGEEGLLGMAFDPSYVANGRVYAFYTNTNGDLVIARFLRLNFDQADSTPTILLTIPHPTNSNHNGGMLAFGTDGCLYASVGDGGGSGDLSNNAQTITTRLGKLLRLDPATGAACTNGGINPFVLTGGAQEIWSRGLRNPWRFSFDRVTNDLYIADVGQGAREEINVSPAPNAGRGLNYGWRFMEGFLCFDPATNCNQGGLTLPVLDYPHLSGACSVTGGYVYRGSAAPALRGTYFYADFCNGFVRSFRYQNSQATSQFEWPLLSRSGITSFGEDAQGELYLMTQGGSLFKIVPN
jgi:glucose/arabinose dehydrogenase|uniref:PQQ-dependent sugar dehydrogenase n=1 Tax=Nitrospira cf. moscoviensis SBR1015 TaxID=96242 RepID=UPI000B3BC216|nr:PQQ-dependent sugar dehydrogenase [Nitrospira cf. moscoviensis SBR1015]